MVRVLIDAGSLDVLKRAGVLADGADAEGMYSDLASLRRATGLAVSDYRRNGRRIDVRVYATDGRAWRLVVWLADSSQPAVVSVTVYERSRPFVGRGHGLVIVLNGPSSVGKSWLMRAFAEAASTPFACLDEPLFGRLPTKFLAWPETIGPHSQGVLAGLAAAARLGNQFIVSAAGIGQGDFETALGDVPVVYVGLGAPMHVLVERQLSQADKFGGLAEESVGVHDGWHYDLRIDTARHTPDQAAKLLAEHLDRTLPGTG